MPRFKDDVPHGVIPAVLLPFNEDFSIDEASYRAHLRDVAAAQGISAITTNAHASEVASCTFDEQRRVLDVTMDEIGGRLPVINGVYADGSLEAQRIAKMAAAGGASALLVFPSNIYVFGQRPEMAVEHFKRIADATDLPLIVFQYPPGEGMGYRMPTLLKICESVPSVRAIKDWCANPLLHERQIRTLQSLPRPVNVLTTHSAWLFSSLVLGCNGLLSGSGSVIAALQAQLFHAVRANDLATAKALNDRIHPTADVFYATPSVDMHNRMKEALVLLGKLPRAVVRPPLTKLPADEIERIRRALIAARLLDERVRAVA
ncbi:MAG TPA: dihydrodipicolinate synthase family protein [Burkholderiales bacterium]|nr:dihydrodipicolinate synthase family protein [Burkholderiales bacterium]